MIKVVGSMKAVNKIVLCMWEVQITDKQKIYYKEGKLNNRFFHWDYSNGLKLNDALKIPEEDIYYKKASF